MSLPAKTIATVATFILLVMGTMHGAQAFSYNPGPPVCDNNPEFQSCLIDVPVGGGAPPVPRQSCIHVPTNPPSQEFPVIFAFHGNGGNGGVMVTTWDKHTEQGMVLVAPSAMDTEPGCRGHWRTIDRDFPDWSDFTAVDACGTPRGHDLALIDAISQHLIAEGIEPQGFYAAGFSNGASFTNQLFITERFAAAFDGFAAVAASISKPMRDATEPAVVGAGPLQPNHHLAPGGEIRKPILLVRGTNEKGFIDWENVIDSVDTHCPAVTSALDVVACYNDHDTFGLGKNNVISTAKATVDWYVDHNNSVERGLESLYPDLGHGSSFADHEDATMAVRQDFPTPPGDEDSAAVARITIIDGQHQWPGKDGNAPPCRSDNNCDIDMTEVILQFWRANANLVTRWR
jgi:poly(3-hydroxybutyrate) depolymerase